MSLITTPNVKNSHSLAEKLFIFLKKGRRQNLEEIGYRI